MKHNTNSFIEDKSGSAVVEATILLPIMIMIFAGLVLLSMYLPGRAVLQRATQYVATGLATERSDSCLEFDESGYSEVGSKKKAFDNVYQAMFSTDSSGEEAKRIIISQYGNNGFIAVGNNLTVDCQIKNYIIYKEIVVTATKKVKMPVNLSFVKFPESIDMTVSSTAVVQNGDEFVRDMDLAVDFGKYVADEFGIDLSGAMSKIQTVMDFIEGK